jgi:hypothetical protein
VVNKSMGSDIIALLICSKLIVHFLRGQSANFFVFELIVDS